MNTEQLRAELLPCPFCGGNAKEYERFNSNTVTCLGCGVKVRQSKMGQGDASERWNSRAALQSQDREDALDKAKRALMIAQAHAPCPLYAEAIEAINQIGRFVGEKDAIYVD